MPLMPLVGRFLFGESVNRHPALGQMNKPNFKVVIHTDGSCSKNPGGDGAFCAHLSCEGYPAKIVRGYIPAPTTNNRAEWAAVIEGVRAIRAECAEVVIYSDSLICVNAVNGVGRKRHKRKNQDLVQEFFALAAKHQVRAEWVPGHSGHRINELCDRTCTETMRDKANPHPQYAMTAHLAAELRAFDSFSLTA